MKVDARSYAIAVQRATFEDWPAIYTLRQDYFASVGAPYVPAPDEVRWVVALESDRVAGALGYVEVPSAGELWGSDLYRVPGALGTAAIVHLARWAFDLARRHEARWRVTVGIENAVMQRACVRHGLVPRAIIFGE